MDVVVTVPKHVWWDWLAEGACANEPSIAEVGEYHWFGSGICPTIGPGERVYIVAHGRVRGWAPLVRIDRPSVPLQAWWWRGAQWGLVRREGAAACTIEQGVLGFRGWRYRWWHREDERDFPEWQTAGIPTPSSIVR